MMSPELNPRTISILSLDAESQEKVLVASGAVDVVATGSDGEPEAGVRELPVILRATHLCLFLGRNLLPLVLKDKDGVASVHQKGHLLLVLGR